MTEVERMLAEPSRQSPLAVVFLGWKILRQISLVNLLILFAVVGTRLSPAGIVAVGMAVLAVLGGLGVLSWWRFVFVVADGELRVTRGVLSEERLAIPLNRVQTVSLEQSIVHQILNLTRVAVDTAGSSVTEFKFDALDRPRAEALRRAVAEHRSSHPIGGEAGAVIGVGAEDTEGVRAAVGVLPDGSPVPPPTGPPTWTGNVPGAPPEPVSEIISRRTVADLVKIGLSSWPWAGLVVIIPLLAALDELREVLGFDLLDDLTRRLEELGEQEPSEVSLTALILPVLGVAAVATIAGWGLQIIRSIITNWELTVTRTVTPAGENLRRDAGLFNRTSLAANLARVQGMRSDQTPIQRRLGIRRLVLPITGEADLHLPGAGDAEYQRLSGLVFPTDPPTMDRMVSPALIYIDARNRSLGLIPPAVAMAVFLGWWALLLLAPFVWGLVAAYLGWRRYRWGFTDHRLAAHSGVLTRRIEDVEYVKTQTATVRRSFFQRRRGLASVSIRTSEGPLEIPMLTEQEACDLRDLVLYRVESSARSWM